MSAPGSQAAEFSLVDEDAHLRLSRKLRLASPQGFGAPRRAIGLMMLTWVPIMVWALLTNQVLWGLRGESVLQHYVLHVRCLVAIPLLILAEPIFHRITCLFSGRLALALTPDDQDNFNRVTEGVRRLSRSVWPWLIMLALALGPAIADQLDPLDDDIAWAFSRDGQFGFGGFWFVWVVRPISAVLLLAWIWRVLMLTLWFRRVAKLRPTLVPSHPDRAGGIGFLELLPLAFSLVTLAVSSILAARWAHEILQHDATLPQFRLPLLVFVVVWTLLMLMPLMCFTPLLVRARHRALLEYSTMVGMQGRLVYRRWIEGKDVGEQPILDAPEIGPVADANTLFEAVGRMRVALVSVRALVVILLPLALPMVIVAGLKVPLREVLVDLVKLLA